MSSSRSPSGSFSSLPPPSTSSHRTRTGSSSSMPLGLPFLRESTTEPMLQTTTPTPEEDESLDTPIAKTSADTITGLPPSSGGGEPYLSVPTKGGGEEEDEPWPEDGETIARTTTNSSNFSTLSSNSGGVEKGGKREREWRENFELDEEENEELVETSGCALAKDILVHGRIFISTHSIGFKANILGFKTKVHFPLSTITSILPKMTALVIPNAIEVGTSDSKYTFATLPNRDATLDLLLALWRAQAPEAYASFLASQPEETPSSSLSPGRNTSSSRRLSISSNRSSMSNDGTAQGGNNSASRGRSESAPNSTSNAAASAVTGVTGNKASSNGGHLNGVKEDGASHEATKAETKAFPEKCLDVRFPTTPEKIFNLMFHDEEFIRELWKKLKFTDIKITPWKDGKRSFEYTKPLSGSVGPSSARCYFEDQIIHEDPEGWYGVMTVTKTPDVPSGKSFEVHTKTCITWEGGQKGGARVVATSKVEWSGRSMLKSVINSSSIQGQKDYNKPLATACRAHIKSHSSEFNVTGETNAEGDVDDEVDSETESAVETSARQQPTSVVDYLMEDPLRSALMALLALSLLFNLLHWIRGGGSGAATKVVQSRAWKGGAEVQSAMERLERIEKDWEGVRTCLGGRFGGLLEG